jgi:hypothetical protein
MKQTMKKTLKKAFKPFKADGVIRPSVAALSQIRDKPLDTTQELPVNYKEMYQRMKKDFQTVLEQNYEGETALHKKWNMIFKGKEL